MGERNFHLHGNSFNRRAIGTEYETLACEYLTRHGYQILCRNFRCRQGEIDIIARDRDYLVFIEVKYRRDEHEGDPAEAVDARKPVSYTHLPKPTSGSKEYPSAPRLL